MRILLTGATGFLGKAWLARRAAEHEITVVGRSRPEGVPLAGHVPVDFADPGSLARLVDAGSLPGSIDRVVHLAVSRGHRGFPGTAADLFEVNVASAAALLRYAHVAGAGGFIMGSTGSVYDGCEDGPLDEARPLTPKRYFPSSKYAAELLAGEYRKFFPVATLRYFAPYGPGQDDRLLPDLFGRVLSGRPVTLPATGGGMQMAAIYVDDALDVLDGAIAGAWDTTMNVAAPGNVTIEELALLIGKVTGRTPVFERTGPAPTYSLVPELDRLLAVRGGKAFTSLEDGLRAMYRAMGPA